MLRTLCFVAFVASSLVLGDPVEVEDCGSTATIVEVDFDGCSELPCIVHHGTHGTGRVKMTANSVTASLTCKLSAIYGIIELPFNGCPNPACNSLTTGDCPTEAGETVVYDFDFEVLPEYPSIDIIAKWRLIADDGSDFMCFKVPLVISNN